MDLLVRLELYQSNQINMKNILPLFAWPVPRTDSKLDESQRAVSPSGPSFRYSLQFSVNSQFFSNL